MGSLGFAERDPTQRKIMSQLVIFVRVKVRETVSAKPCLCWIASLSEEDTRFGAL